MTGTPARQSVRLCAAVAGLALMGACERTLDFDLRGQVGDNFTTADAAQAPGGARPPADARGVISYPNYQVAVAQRGDTVADVANRIGLPPAELARFNGVRPDDSLRPGEVLALPRRVSEPSPATGAAQTGPIRPASQVDITTLAGNAIDSAAPTAPAAAPPTASGGIEPVRHKVARGETIYTISRLYNVPVRTIADWNRLDRNYTLREGQFLLVPTSLAAPEPEPETEPTVTAPGTGSRTPEPPSASRPLPTETPPAASAPAPTPPAPKLETSPAPTRDAQMGFPVDGTIVREYSKGRNDGIDISAPAGTAVKAAASGVVAAITSDADNIPIVIVKHPDNLLTVYANLGDIAVKKDDRVSRGQAIGKVRAGSPPYLHFEVRRGFDSVDPMPFLQ